MVYEKIVTLYDTAEHAEAAKHKLELAGFPAGEISLTGKKALNVSGDSLREPSLWHKLFGDDIKAHEATEYGNTIDAGGVVLTARVPEADVPKAMRILNADEPVEAEHHALEGSFADRAASPAPLTAPAIPAVGHGETAARDAAPSRESIARAAIARSAAAPDTSYNQPAAPRAALAEADTTARADLAADNRDQVLRLAEEKLDVGKRLVERGITRIRRFVTDEPVEANVTLHEERADVTRRAATDSAVLDNVDWGEKTIEIRETAEEAVVNKTAHVAEEVVISKKVSDQVKTVHDTVRRQHVEVEKIPGSNAADTAINGEPEQNS